MGWVGAVIVAGLMTVAWFGGQSWSDRELDRWRDQRAEVSQTNLDRSIANAGVPDSLEKPLDPAPEPSFAAEHPNVFAGLASLAVGVVGAIVVLLISISLSLQRPRPT